MALPSSGGIAAADLTPEPIQTITGDVGTATLVRAIMHFDLSTEVDVNDPQTGAVGLYVVSHEGFDQTAFSDPNADFFQDWFYWTSRGIDVRSNNQAAMASWDVDIRSKRRLRGGYKFIMVAAGFSGNTVALELNVSMRLLWAMP